MATGSFPTISDLTSRMDGAGKQMHIAELLSQATPTLRDMPFKEGTEMMGHSFSYRTSIPRGAFRQLNSGVGYSKSTTGKATLGMGDLEGYSQVDRLLAEMSGSVEGFRTSEEVAFLEGLGQTWEETLWYGNSVENPAEFMGLSNFYNTLQQGTAQNASNVINGGGVGSDNASLWLICWGTNQIYGTYPRGSKAGLTSEDKADTTPAFDNLGNRYEAYTMWFRQMGNIVPEDWRYAARIANIDVTASGLAGPNALDLFLAMSQADMLPPTLSKEASGITEVDAPTDPSPAIMPYWYTNRTVRFWMDAQGMRNRNVLLTLNDAAGKPQDVIRGIRVRVADRLLITEDAVV
jgi:hypothetical protein